MDSASSALTSPLHATASLAALEQAFVESRASTWDLTVEAFAAAVAMSVTHRFASASTDQREVDAYVRTLHVADLALACACQQGSEAAWEHFIREMRPSLYAAARAMGEGARERADGLFAELFGLTEKGEPRRSLLAYYHGRARLTVWLRTVLAQRQVDAHRVAAKTTPLDDTVESSARSPVETQPDPHRQQYLARAQAALDAAVARLEPRDRLRLRLYYGEQLAMAQIGRMLGEHEATVSRHLNRARRQLREWIEATLQRDYGMSPAAIRECMNQAADSPELNLAVVLEEGRQGEG